MRRRSVKSVPTGRLPVLFVLVLVLGERHLCRILTRYLAYYHQARTHLASDKGHSEDAGPPVRFRLVAVARGYRIVTNEEGEI